MIGGTLGVTERLDIEQRCRMLVLSAAHLCDAGEYDLFARLFTESATLTRPNGTRLVGRDSILQAYRARDPQRLTRHLIVSTLVTSWGTDAVSATSQVLLWSGSKVEPKGEHGYRAEQRQLVGEFDDDFVMSAGGWKIAARESRFLFHHECS